MTAFRNKKPKLLGDFSITVGTPLGTLGGNINLSSIDFSDHQLGTLTLTPTKPKNLILLNLSVFATNNSNASIKEGATTIGAEFNGIVTGNRTFLRIIENASLSAHVYTFNTIFDTQPYQYGKAPGGFTFFGMVIDIEESHDTKNTNLISG